ncbi:hypothetical protein V6x_20120 [Gimesia chilikensis]|uniref:Uncharacterized protein n=1 Tax=Gimesia chilikensis TaxID=2605989 RepID=A0A517WAN1_9PLAN|nr:hypothetical protein V6x_20120 [Gimesia chilikensis]
MPKNKKKVRPNAIQDKRSKPETDRETDQVKNSPLSKLRAASLATLPLIQTPAGTRFLRCDLPLSSSNQTRHCMKRQRNAVAENR